MRRKKRQLDEMLDAAAAKAAGDPMRELNLKTAALISEIADDVYAMRNEKDWTQEELAESCGMRQPAIAVLEDPGIDREPKLSTLVKVALALGKELVIRFEDPRADSEGAIGPLVVSTADDYGHRQPGLEA